MINESSVSVSSLITLRISPCVFYDIKGIVQHLNRSQYYSVTLCVSSLRLSAVKTGYAVCWSALLAHSKKVLGLNPGSAGASRRGVCMFSACPSQLPPASSHGPKTRRLTGDSKLPVDVKVSVTGCLSLFVGPAIDWRDPAPRPVSAGTGWMDGWMSVVHHVPMFGPHVRRWTP